MHTATNDAVSILFDSRTSGISLPDLSLHLSLGARGVNSGKHGRRLLRQASRSWAEYVHLLFLRT
jgi:hypothetical protein